MRGTRAMCGPPAVANGDTDFYVHAPPAHRFYLFFFAMLIVRSLLFNNEFSSDQKSSSHATMD